MSIGVKTTNLPTGSLPAEGASEVEHRERSDESETEPSDRSRRAGGHEAEGAFPSRNGVERWEWAWSIIDYILSRRRLPLIARRCCNL